MNEYGDEGNKTTSSYLSGRKNSEVSVLSALENRGDEFVPDLETKNRLISQVRKGVLGPLSPEKEQGVFVLYCVGNDFDTIALKTNFNLDILFITATYYDWKTKAAALMSNGKNFSIEEIQKDLARTVLVATYMSVQEELSEVLSGNKKASKSCSLIPKNTAALERLLNTVNQLENSSQNEDSGNGGSTVYNQNNIQINHGSESAKGTDNIIDAEEVQDPAQLTEKEREEIEQKAQERKQKYAALRGER